MRSLRLEPQLDDRVRRAAAAEGTSVSEFLRRAAAERADRALSHRNGDRLADVIGVVHGGGAGRARESGAAFGELLAERRRAGR
jgi:Ribbon-helix-helix protein, copG family